MVNQSRDLKEVVGKLNADIRKTTQAATFPLMENLPTAGFVRIWQVVGNRKKGITPLIPISRTSFLNGIKSGKYKITPIKLGERTTAYKVEEIKQLIIQLGGAAHG